MSARHEHRSAPAIDDLIRRCLDGVASETEAALLDGLVATDPRAARALAAAARWESTLEIVARGTSEASFAPRPTDLSTRRRKTIVWSAAGAVTAAATAAVIVWSLSSSGARPAVNTLARSATAPASAPTAPPSVATAPEPSPAVAEPEHRPTELRLADGSTATLLGTDARLETRRSTAAAIDLALVRGAARFDVVHRPGRRFRIWVASAYIEVVGTAFTVDRLAEGVRVSVDRGVVKVVSAQGRMRLAAGASDVFPLDGGGGGTDGEVAPAKRPPAARAPARTDDQAGALLRASEHARKEGRPDEALVLLRRFLEQHSSDPRAPYAGFIIGRVLLEELNRPREAAAAFARVEVLNPRTPLIEDALAREVESWFRAGDLEKARQRARLFVDRYPHGRRAGEVRRYGEMDGQIDGQME